MNPETKLNTIAVTVAATIIVCLWIGFSKAAISHPWIAILASGVFSIGLYRVIVYFLLQLFRRVSWIKKLILGPAFLHGTWVGFFIGRAGSVRYFVEVFEQDLTRTVVRGRSFREDASFHGFWVSDNVSVDPVRARLSYIYETDAIGNTFVNPGIAVFQLERKDITEPAIRMQGFSSDLYNSSKLPAYEKKISEKLIFDNSEAIEKARDLYESQQVFFPTAGMSDSHEAMLLPPEGNSDG